MVIPVTEFINKSHFCLVLFIFFSTCLLLFFSMFLNCRFFFIFFDYRYTFTPYL